MRILVISDTHGDVFSMRKAILSQSKAEIVIHLGDGEREFSELKSSFPDKMFVSVRGNCDWGSSAPDEEELEVEGVKIFYTHGHMYQVKQTRYNLISEARSRKCNVVLYGHTHQSETTYDDGLYIMNPGSLHGYGGSYGIIDITKAGIVTNVIE